MGDLTTEVAHIFFETPYMLPPYLNQKSLGKPDKLGCKTSGKPDKSGCETLGKSDKSGCKTSGKLEKKLFWIAGELFFLYFCVIKSDSYGK